MKELFLVKLQALDFLLRQDSSMLLVFQVVYIIAIYLRLDENSVYVSFITAKLN